MNKTVLITGGAGYVGSALVPSLLKDGYKVIVYDLYLFGDVFKNDTDNLVQIKGDIRDREKLIQAGRGADYLIHLACIANDPSFELNPQLGKSINYDAFFNVLETVKQNQIGRIVYASSASVYGTQEGEVTEDIRGIPLTDYAKFKLLCEDALKESGLNNYVVVRPASIFGYAPRLRLDLIINNFTIKALINKKISFMGGWQLRPHINVNDMVEIYKLLIKAPDEAVHGNVFNACLQNTTIKDAAELVVATLKKHGIGDAIDIEQLDVFDKRSYHLNSEKIQRELQFKAEVAIETGILSIAQAFRDGLISDGLNNPLYHNVKLMQSIKLL